MEIVFRTDASLQIGSGHVMRCLTLADALRDRGEQCHFICREHYGNLIDEIRQRGYRVDCIAVAEQQRQQHGYDYTNWLGSTWQVDAQESVAFLKSHQADWLVVDHYALDQRWESTLKSHYKKLMVIDDLADREHLCDLLLDQNLGRQQQDYKNLVPAQCQLYTGPNYSLLRPEFAALRPYSLQRRQNQNTLDKLLITLGGIDKDNITAQVLHVLKACDLPRGCCITVVMGLNAPWLQNVNVIAAQMPWPTEVVVNVKDMAQRMGDCDLAISAAGGTALELCCMGVPTLMIVLAENQQSGARALQASNTARLILSLSNIKTELPLFVQELRVADYQIRLSRAASSVTDGQGVNKVIKAMGAADV